MTNLSIKNVPETLVVRLRSQARQHHRSLQGELLAILEAAVQPTGLTIQELHQRVKELGIRTGDDSVAMVREDRDAR
jgi:plasmid stability protein